MSPSDTTSTPDSKTTFPTRRAFIAMIAASATAGSAGCLGLFGAEPRDDTDDTGTPTKDNGGPVTRNNEGPTDRSDDDGSDGGTTSTPNGDTTPVLGPVDSPPSNDEYDAEDPQGDLILTDVTFTITGGRYNPQHLREDEIIIEADRESFTATGRVTTKFKCDTFEFERVIVSGTHAVIRIDVTTTEDDSCRTVENSPWSHEFRITGKFGGGRPKTMTMLFVGKETNLHLQAEKDL